MKIRYILLIFISMIMASLSLYFQFHGNPFTPIKSDNLLSIVGILITSIAFAVGTYFVVVAVSVYIHAREIEKTQKTVEEISNDISKYLQEIIDYFKNIKREGNYILSNMLIMVDDFISFQISCYTDSSNIMPKAQLNIKNRINHLIRLRANMALKYTSMDRNRRLSLIKELLAVAEIADIKEIEKLIVREADDKELIELAEFILNKLYTKFSIKQQSH